MPKCRDCDLDTDESFGRWVLMSGDSNTLEWYFVCISCVRYWRHRSLKRQGRSEHEAQRIVEEEYPAVYSKK